MDAGSFGNGGLVAKMPTISPDNPFADLLPRPGGGALSPNNPFADLLPQASPSAAPELSAAPTSGVTIAPKGGIAREATPAEAGQLDYAAASAGDIGSKAAENLVPSAQRFGSDIYSVVSDPVGTGKNLAKVVAGSVEKLIPGKQSHEVYANAVGKFFADRYGGIENLKRTMAEDPVGFLADAATVLSGGEFALARAPGAVGQIGRVAGTVSRTVDPINATLKAAKTVGKGVGSIAATSAGLTTGAGGQAMREAARAGFEGGERAKALTEHMRGNVPMENVVADARTGLDAIKQERQAAYRAGMADLSKDKTVLDFGTIDATLAGTKPVKEFKGVSLEPSVKETVTELAKVLDEWRNYDPAEFHTAEGLDALKQRLGDIRDGTKPGSTSEKVATQVYNVVKDQIVKQAPRYAKTMKNYQEASDLIREIERTLSQNRNASIDTSLRKLQSVMRNNANTNYGRRTDLVRLLEEHGAKHLMAKLAGQSLSSIEPRGLARAVAGIGGVATGAVGVSTLNPAVLVPYAAQLALQSPRLAGETAYLGGRAVNALSRFPTRNALMTGYQMRGVDQARIRP